MSKISVIVPVYKVEKYLERCIVSILSQSFLDFDFVLVDDGSPDCCGEICDNYAGMDGRVYIIHKLNGGLSDARNVGIFWSLSQSDSSWISFVDSDDWIHKNYLLLLYRACVDNNLNISLCDSFDTDGYNDLPLISDKKAIIVSPQEVYFDSGVVVAMRKLYKKELFFSVRYPYRKYHEDQFITYKLLFSQDRIAYVHEELYYYFIRSDSIMHHKWTPKHLDIIDAYKEQIKFFQVLGNKYMINGIVYNFSQSLYENYRNALRYNYITEAKKCRYELKKLLKKHMGLFSIKQYPHLFETAFPRLIKFYWLFMSLAHKIK